MIILSSRPIWATKFEFKANLNYIACPKRMKDRERERERKGRERKKQTNKKRKEERERKKRKEKRKRITCNFIPTISGKIVFVLKLV